VIFALLDYARYCTRAGRYSSASLAGEGWIIAAADSFADDHEPPPGCYFVMHRRRNFVSWAIMYVTQSRANHAGLFVGNGMIVDALTRGTVKHQLADYFDGLTYLVTNAAQPIRGDARDAIVAAAESHIGTPYAWFTSGMIGIRAITGHDKWHRAHLRIYCDVSVLLGALALPHVWLSWWPPTSLWLLLAYMLSVGIGRVRAVQFQNRRSAGTPAT